MFKITGILFAFLASSLFGLYKADEIRRRRELLVEFQELLLHISTEISYFKEPLPQIFERVMTEDNSASNLLLRQCYFHTKQSNGNFLPIWLNAVKETYAHEPLNDDDLDILRKCGSFLGQSDFNSQKGHFSFIEAQLSRQIRDAEEAIKTKGSLYQKAGVSLGAIFAIAML